MTKTPAAGETDQQAVVALFEPDSGSSGARFFYGAVANG
jgi:hypothetical protein